ncbi:hypothetical protein [Brochothrix campestris]|uniref:Uncharacterized protein n=1 Tax=Brochothrix campestris FSL F6-1037 TaxID=1265861 RepID=W7CEJ3_9LIST|nr:hypothetical protein [Brochothrix campestris]EUJ35650.1 hypothetical protein BCAMP_11515 [Brochothrix campestris FSL F6-1037]
MTKQLQAAHKEIQSLKAKNRDLESEVTWLKAFVSDSRTFKTFVELIKDRVEDSEVKRIENRENPPKRNRGMER